jgi:hypothetical protein
VEKMLTALERELRCADLTPVLSDDFRKMRVQGTIASASDRGRVESTLKADPIVAETAIDLSGLEQLEGPTPLCPHVLGGGYSFYFPEGDTEDDEGMPREFRFDDVSTLSARMPARQACAEVGAVIERSPAFAEVIKSAPTAELQFWLGAPSGQKGGGLVCRRRGDPTAGAPAWRTVGNARGQLALVVLKSAP